MSDATTEIWHVQLGTGEVRRWTIDELDAAFNDGAIHENTFVLQPGSTNWVKLGDAAGLGEEPAAAPPPISSLSPVAMASSMGQYQAFSTPPPAYARELDDLDLDNVQLKSSKKKTAIIAMAAVALIGIVGVTAVVAGSKESGDTSLASGAANAPANVPAAAAPPPPPAQDPAAGQRLSDDQRAQLLAADKVLDTKMKAKAAAIAATAPASHAARSKMKASQPFVKSHNKYDPLNGEIGGK